MPKKDNKNSLHSKLNVIARQLLKKATEKQNVSQKEPKT